MNIRNIVPGITVLAFVASGLVAQEPPPEVEDPNRADAGQLRPPRPPVPVIPEMKTGTPNSWFEHTKLFMGEFLDKEIVSGKFEFKNPTAKPQVWRNLTGSCQCARAVITVGDRKYELTKQPVANSLHRLETKDGVTNRIRVMEIPIGAKDTGKVEVHMEMGGLQGLKDASLGIVSTDEKLKQFSLLWQAKGIKLFDLTPNDVFLNDMKWDDQRKFKFVVASGVNPDFKLLDHEPLPDYVKITSKKQITQPNGKKAWEIEGTYGPNADARAGGAGIKFKTDWGKDVNFTIVASVTGPITIEPGTFLSFGKIRKGEGAERKITFTPNDDFDLKLVNVKFPKLTIAQKYIKAVSAKDGKKLVVTVKISPDVEGTFLVRGAVTLELNHPSLGVKTFNFNGILR